jgi:hypothetical protein
MLYIDFLDGQVKAEMEASQFVSSLLKREL